MIHKDDAKGTLTRDAAALAIYYHGKEIPGWLPISHMVDLAARLLGADVHKTGEIGSTRGGAWRGYLRNAARGGTQSALFIARNPAEVRAFLELPDFRTPKRLRALWIIDSFRTEDLLSARLMSQFDVVAYCQAYDSACYTALVRDRALLLPWGTDALGLGSAAATRPYDVMRLGRQPVAWDNDDHTHRLCAARNLTFHGRPPYIAFVEMQRSLVQDWYGKAKFIIAHSNLAAPAPYTHKTKEYITARWTDALAAGAVVAGVQPRRDLDLLNWPEATLDFAEVDLEHNLDQLQDAAADWTPKVALRNHLGALERLDWRWRFKALCDRLDISAPALEADLSALRARCDDLRAQLGNAALNRG